MPPNTPMFPEQHSQRPLSQAARALQSKYHPLLSTALQSIVRAQLSISEWLLIGSFLQTVIIAGLQVLRLPILYALTPTVALAIFKVIRTIMITCGFLDNHHMRNIKVGRHTAVFPEEDGTFHRAPGAPVGGKGMCVIMLSTKCNHPLGILYPPFGKLVDYATAMFEDLEENAEEYGFLGFSGYTSTATVTKPIIMNLMYFKSHEHMHKYVHSATHRAGWDWWNANFKHLNELTIVHEVYVVAEGKFENIYTNAPIFDFAATQHGIENENGERKWVCPVLDAKKGFKNSASRLGNGEKSGQA